MIFSARFIGIANIVGSSVQHQSCRNLWSRSIRKFYKSVSVSQTALEGHECPMFEVQLDRRKLRTPGGNKFVVPNEILAFAVAHEWDSQRDTIKRHVMHLTSLCNQVIDNEHLETPQCLVDGIMQYADTDTICFRSCEPDDLAFIQSASWDPVVKWISDRYQIEPKITNSLTASAQLSKPDRDILVKHFKSYNRWGLVGIRACVENLKSVFLTLAALDGFCSAAKAVELSQTEQLFQVHRWGEVPSFHDIETAELNARVSAALFLALVSHNRRSVQQKLNSAQIRYHEHAL